MPQNGAATSQTDSLSVERCGQTGTPSQLGPKVWSLSSWNVAGDVLFQKILAQWPAQGVLPGEGSLWSWPLPGQRWTTGTRITPCLQTTGCSVASDRQCSDPSPISDSKTSAAIKYDIVLFNTDTLNYAGYMLELMKYSIQMCYKRNYKKTFSEG